MRYFLLTCFIFAATICAGQTIIQPNPDSVRMVRIEAKLSKLAVTDTAYLSYVDISAGKISLSELLRNIAKVSMVNLSVKSGDNVMVSCNFSRTRIVDLIYFLCKEYNMDVDIIGNIVSIYPVAARPGKVKEPDISYVVSGNLLGYDLNGERLIDVIKRITSLTGVNIVVPQPMYDRKVSGYVSEMPFDEALYTLGSINGLETEKSKRGVWNFSEEQRAVGTTAGQQPAFIRRSGFSANQLSVDSLGMITAQIGRGNISDIIIDLCTQQKLNYFFISPISQQTSIYVKNVNFATLLSVLLSGTQYSYYCENSIYFFGSNSKDATAAAVQIIPLTCRSVDKVEELIPSALKTGLQITKFVDQNSLVVTGDSKLVSRVETFIRSIDIRVPLITIEIIIVDATKSSIQEAGINMGIGTAPAVTSGTLSPGINMNLNANSVNNLIQSFNGFGSVNLGKVTPDFYMSLKFLEDNGTIELRSTPKLSTLNGHEATLKSGETKYYKEVLNNFIGSMNPIQSESFTWKSVEANLDIKITPFVSTDNHITLNIEIIQSEFTAREEKNAPPGTATRSFKSLIRVQNEDMVLLGGIDRNSREKNTSGLPFIARVPVLKWIFGSTKDNKIDHKLNLFIKPTIVE